MLQPKVVLAPIDFSESALQAAEAAAEMAAKFSAALVLVHVVPALPKLPPDVSVFKEGDYERRLHEDAVKRVAQLAAKYTQAGLSVRSEVGVANDVAMEIVRIADRQKADLIAIATHGVTGWNRLVFGSIAEKVVHLAHCSVLVLRAGPHDNP